MVSRRMQASLTAKKLKKKAFAAKEFVDEETVTPRWYFRRYSKAISDAVVNCKLSHLLVSQQPLYMLPRRVGFSPAFLEREDALLRLALDDDASRDVRPALGTSMEGQKGDREDYIYSEEYSPGAVSLARTCKAHLGMLKTVRNMMVCGRPIDALEFELSIMKLHLNMLNVAKEERKEVVLGYGSKGRYDTNWYYDVWIEGEGRFDGVSGRSAGVHMFEPWFEV